MPFNIQSYKCPLTAQRHNHAQRRLRFALTRTTNRITRVVVRYLTFALNPIGALDGTTDYD